MSNEQHAAVYWAGPLFTDAEREWNARQVAAIRAKLPQLNLLVPQEFCAAHEAVETNDQGKGRLGKPDFGAIFRSCRDNLDAADLVIAVLDGADADSGTCWEMGYAHAKGKTVLGFRTDWRPAEDGGGNAMLTRSCSAVCGTLMILSFASARGYGWNLSKRSQNLTTSSDLRFFPRRR